MQRHTHTHRHTRIHARAHGRRRTTHTYPQVCRSLAYIDVLNGFGLVKALQLTNGQVLLWQGLAWQGLIWRMENIQSQATRHDHRLTGLESNHRALAQVACRQRRQATSSSRPKVVLPAAALSAHGTDEEEPQLLQCSYRLLVHRPALKRYRAAENRLAQRQWVGGCMYPTLASRWVHGGRYERLPARCSWRRHHSGKPC